VGARSIPERAKITRLFFSWEFPMRLHYKRKIIPNVWLKERLVPMNSIG
jgi:hypothetical protein